MTGLERRLAACILAGGTFTADDVTDTGQVTLDAGHRPNARQNGIGALFARAASRGLIRFTGTVTRSRSPHRKGGAIRVWVATDYGRLWAADLDDEARPR